MKENFTRPAHVRPPARVALDEVIWSENTERLLTFWRWSKCLLTHLCCTSSFRIMKQNDFFSLIRSICRLASGEGNTNVTFFFFFLLRVTDMQIPWKSDVGTARLLIAKMLLVINGKWKLSSLWRKCLATFSQNSHPECKHLAENNFIKRFRIPRCSFVLGSEETGPRARLCLTNQMKYLRKWCIFSTYLLIRPEILRDILHPYNNKLIK